MLVKRVIDLRGGDPLSRYFVRVFTGHLLVFLVLFLIHRLTGQLFVWQGKDFQVIQSSVKVDVVAMPKFTLRELRKMALPDINAVEGKGISRQAVESGGESELSFLAKIKKFSQKKVKVKKYARSNKANAKNNRLGKLILAGNKLSAGASFTGDVNNESLSELQRYMESLPQFVRPYWVLPGFLKDQVLRCRIQIFIGKGGKLLRAMVVESSGDAQYDDYALQAVHKAQFPEPSESLLKSLVRGVAVLGFPL